MLSGSEVMRPTVHTIAVADSRNAAVAFACLGSALGFFLGLAGGIAGRSYKRAWRAAATGSFLGAVVGVALPLALVVPYNRLQRWLPSEELIVSLAMHALFWGALGAVAGLAFSIGLGTTRRWRWALFGLVGACLGAAVFEIVGAAIDPLALTSEPISTTWSTRLLARLLVGFGTGASLGLASVSSRKDSDSFRMETGGPDAQV
jgi:hypothetical protein